MFFFFFFFNVEHFPVGFGIFHEKLLMCQYGWESERSVVLDSGRRVQSIDPAEREIPPERESGRKRVCALKKLLAIGGLKIRMRQMESVRVDATRMHVFTNLSLGERASADGRPVELIIGRDSAVAIMFNATSYDCGVCTALMTNGECGCSVGSVTLYR